MADQKKMEVYIY